ADAEASREARMFEPNRGHAPRLGPRGERRILHFGGVIKDTEPTGDRNATGVTRPPDHRVELVFLTLKSIDKMARRPGRDFVTDRSNVFINQWRVDKRILP